MNLLALGRRAAARRAAEEAVRADPHSASALLTLFQARFALRDRRGAAELARALVDQFPSAAAAHDADGLASMLARRWRRAEDAFRRALELEPGSAVVVSHLALALERQRRHREALETFQLAASTDPADEGVQDDLVGFAERLLTIRGPAVVLAVVAWLCLWAGRTLPLTAGVTAGLVAATVVVGVAAIATLRWWRRTQLDENVRMLVDASWLRQGIVTPPYPVFSASLGVSGLAVLLAAGWYTQFDVDVLVPLAVFLAVVLPLEGPRLWRQMLRRAIRIRASAATGSARG